MALRQRIRQLCNKIKNNFRGGCKPLSCNCNWPELNKYFGCCSISTGIYICSTLTTIFISASVASNLYILISIYQRKDFFAETETDEYDYGLLFKGVFIYYMFWDLFKLFEVIRNLWIIYAVYKKRVGALKMILYIGVPCWIFDIFLTSIASFIFAFHIKFLLALGFLSEGYNLLAVSSKYKKLSGKSRIVPEQDTEPRVEPVFLNRIINPPHRGLRFPRSDNQPHCPSCTCFLNQNNNDDEGTVNSTEIDSPSSATEFCGNPENCNEDEPKKLNFKDEDIVYNHDYLEDRNNSLFENVASSSLVEMTSEQVPANRPTTLALKLEKREEKKDIADTAVIYDENQFNVGNSPVLECV